MTMMRVLLSPQLGLDSLTSPTAPQLQRLERSLFCGICGGFPPYLN